MKLAAFASIHNHNEQIVLDAVLAQRDVYPAVASDELMADVACVALNRLPPRYIRHTIDFAFYTPDRERIETDNAVHEAVHQAFAFVQARRAMRARG
jgi:hypothetical protein